MLFIATILNWNQPLLPIHILWVNLVTDSLPLALGVEPAELDIMDENPGILRQVLARHDRKNCIPGLDDWALNPRGLSDRYERWL